MYFELIDMDKWNRKEYFQHYFSDVPCTYSMTVKLDITNIKDKKLYPVMLYCITSVVNRHCEFRTALNNDGKLGIYKEMLPSYTVFNKETETFTNIWTDYTQNFEEFLNLYQEDLKQFGKTEGITGKPNIPDNSFTVSMVPWTTFEGFNLNLQKGYDYLKPIFTMGKYYREKDRYMLPLSVQVHHAVCDGFHICRFINELQEMINGKI